MKRLKRNPPHDSVLFELLHVSKRCFEQLRVLVSRPYVIYYVLCEDAYILDNAEILIADMLEDVFTVPNVELARVRPESCR